MFRGEIKPVRQSATYGLGIILVTGVMIVLPLLYIAFIALAAYGVYYHAVNHTGMLQYGYGRAKIFVVLAYAAPMIIGAILVLFMIKPLFARPAREVRTRSLTESGERLLFAFVRRLCQVVGAPAPQRIDVDYQLNASAGFRRGLLSFVGADLVLTIGIPLAAGLSLRQFTGVLAHEFGHFSQGTGMRLTYVVRRINGWFARVVYERDEWDEWLAETAAEVDFRIGWILLLSQLGVWISRRVLWMLMIVGHAISGYMLRQMEYDADRYEARVAGSDTFTSTALRLHELGAAYALTQRAIVRALTQSKFPDNIPKLMLQLGDSMPAKVRRQVKESLDQETTGFFDTHPSDRQRIKSAQREDAAGIFHAAGPAAALFRDFDALSRNVTWDLYCVLGAGIRPQDMDPVDAVIGTGDSPASAEAAVPSTPVDEPIPFDSVDFQE